MDKQSSSSTSKERKKVVKTRPTARKSSVVDNSPSPISKNVTLVPRVDKPVPHCPHKTSLIFVLDLDETLVHTGYHTLGTPADHKYVLDLDGTKLRGTIRPYARQFLKFVHHFSDRVIIWSAGTAEYVEPAVEVLYDGMTERPALVLSREDCQKVPHGDGFFLSKSIPSLAERIGYNPEQMVMVDDKPHTFIFNPYNGILIPEYKGEAHDEFLLNLMEWMAKPHVRRSDTVIQLDKTNIFPQPTLIEHTA